MPYTTYHPKLLILDDEPVALKLLSQIAHDMSLFSKVSACRSSREALDLLNKEAYDIFLLDYEVDERNGLDVFELAKQMHQPVTGVLVTAHDEKEVIISAMQAGIRDFIEKPIHPHILSNALIRAWEELEVRIVMDTESRNHLELLESLPDIVYKIDMDGYIQYINKTVEELGVKQAELKGKHITRIIAAEDYHSHSLQTVLDSFREQMDAENNPPKLVNERRGGSRKTQNLRIRMISRSEEEGTRFREGTLVSFGEISARGILEGSVVTGSVGIIRDITEREKERRQLKEALGRLRDSEEALKQAYNAKSQFIANMSHEIRTPLNAIRGMVDLMKNAATPEEQQGQLEIINASCRTLQFIVDDILDISRIEANRLRLKTVNFSPDTIAKEVLEVVRNLPEAETLDIRMTFGEKQCPELEGDAERIKQILLNLVHNAVKFTEKGFVELSMACRDVDKKEYQRLICAVKDSGRGIAMNKLETIFERFEQGDETSPRSFGGTGLGLAISRKLARLMRGDIKVESELGHGSVFTFTVVLPRASAAQKLVYDDVAVLCDGPVLVVEDNMTNRAVIKSLLENLGVEADTAKDGADAVIKAKNRVYQVIFMDLHMPGESGIEAARKIRNSGGLSANTFIVALTGDVMEDACEHCREAGMDECIYKPLGRRELQRMLNLLGNRRSSAKSEK